MRRGLGGGLAGSTRSACHRAPLDTSPCPLRKRRGRREHVRGGQSVERPAAQKAEARGGQRGAPAATCLIESTRTSPESSSSVSPTLTSLGSFLAPLLSLIFVVRSVTGFGDSLASVPVPSFSMKMYVSSVSSSFFTWTPDA